MNDPVSVTLEAVREAFGSGLRCLYVTGEALQGGGIPGLWTLEFHAWLAVELVVGGRAPAWERARELRRDLRVLELEEYGLGEVELTVVAYDEPTGVRRLPPPGAYRILVGEPPPALLAVTDATLREDAGRHLDKAERVLGTQIAEALAITNGPANRAMRRLSRSIRTYALDVATLVTGQPQRVWANGVESTLPALASVGLGVLPEFLRATAEWPERRADPRWIDERLDEGFAALGAVAAWWASDAADGYRPDWTARDPHAEPGAEAGAEAVDETDDEADEEAEAVDQVGSLPLAVASAR